MLAVFFVPVTVIYWIFSEDWTGTACLAFSILLAAMVRVGWTAWFTWEMQDGLAAYDAERMAASAVLNTDAIDAHQALREISLKRKVSGGKDLGMFEKMKLKRAAKDDKTNMLNAEKMLAYNPGDTDHGGVSGLDCLAFHLFAKLSGLVPLVGIASGRCFAGNAVLLRGIKHHVARGELDACTDRFDVVFAALADPTRRAILARLAGGEASVTEIAEPFAMSLPAISRHLKVLENAGLISRGQEAQWRPRRIEAAPLKDVSDWLEIYRRLWEERLDRLGAERQPRRAAVDHAADRGPVALAERGHAEKRAEAVARKHVERGVESRIAQVERGRTALGRRPRVPEGPPQAAGAVIGLAVLRRGPRDGAERGVLVARERAPALLQVDVQLGGVVVVGHVLLDENRHAAHHVEDFIAKHDIDCEYEATGNAFAAVSRGQMGRVRRVAKIVTRAGGHVEVGTAAELGIPCGFVGGMRETIGGRMNPGRFSLGMRRVLLDSAARVFEQTKVTDVVRDDGQVVRLGRGHVECHGAIGGPAVPVTGSGIGLSLSRQIMQMHNGSLSVESEPEVRTVFTLRF